MAFTPIENIKKDSSWLANGFFYGVIILLLTSIVSYGFLLFNIYLQEKKIEEIDKKLQLYGTPEQKSAEQKLLFYKKKIETFSTLISSHKISANFFTFLERKTLPSVWFTSISLSVVRNEINLLGETENMETLSKQVKILEDSTDYVKNITVLNSSITETGRIKFTINMILEPQIFTYLIPTLPESQNQIKPVETTTPSSASIFSKELLFKEFT